MVTGIKIHDGHGHDVRLAILNGSGIKFLVHVGLKNAQSVPSPGSLSANGDLSTHKAQKHLMDMGSDNA